MPNDDVHRLVSMLDHAEQVREVKERYVRDVHARGVRELDDVSYQRAVTILDMMCATVDGSTDKYDMLIGVSVMIRLVHCIVDILSSETDIQPEVVASFIASSAMQMYHADAPQQAGTSDEHSGDKRTTTRTH